MTGSGSGRDDDPNDERRLMTRIDGKEARLLVHIEPIADGDGDTTTADEPPTLDE